MSKNIVIIGNSAAGTAAIESIRKKDRESRIIQLSDETHPLYSRCLLSYYLSGAIDKKGLNFRETEFHRQADVQLKAGPGSRAVELDTRQHRVTTDNGETYEYDRLLIATGATAKTPENIPRDTEGIYVFRSITDVEAIKSYLSNAKRAIVLGGGLIGMKAAAALNACGLKTTVIIRSDRVLSQMIDYDAAQHINKKLQQDNIEILHKTGVSEIHTQNNRFAGITTDQGQKLEAEILIVAKGVTPNTQLVQPTGITAKWGIVTDAHMQTEAENIYAAGDVAEAYDIAIEEHTVNALWTCAVQQGRIAGQNMIGQEIAYNGAIGMNSLNISDISLISFGITTPKNDSKYRILVHDQPERDIYKKIVLGNDNRIKGIILLGKIDNAGVLLSVIKRKIDVTPFEDELLNDGFNFGTLLKYGGETQLESYYSHKKL